MEDLTSPGPPQGSLADSSPPSPAMPAGLEAVRLLGRGKVALVYLARETELDRLVAVKVLRPDYAGDEVARQRFEREARSAASLTHPNVVSVHRFGRLDDGTPYLVMAYVTGRTLADRLKADGPMTEHEVRSALVQVASALAAAHRKGIVHRDVRPENVLVEEETGRVMLSDFGIAAVLDGGGSKGPRLTRTGQLIGEPRYASPEQLRGEAVTGQSDVYTLGVVAYELLTREGPYRATSTQEWIRAHLTAEPRPISRVRPDVSSDLEALLLRCLSKEPAHRPRAEDVVRRLEGLTGAGGTATGALSPDLGLRRRRIPQFVLGAGGIGITSVGLVASLVDTQRLPSWTLDHTLNVAIWGFIGTCVVAWFHGERGRQTVTPLEVSILASVALGWAVITAMLILR